MQRIMLTFIGFLCANCFAQFKGEYYDYKTAYSNPNSVKIISIQCAFDNIQPTDGCNEIPDSLYLFKNLEVLSIRETHVQKIPDNINKLVRLKCVDLSCNRFMNFEIELCKLNGLDSLTTL